jgi:hypothetical protein
MEASKKISQLIHIATNALGETGPLYKEVSGLDREKSLKTLGKALMTIWEIRDSICELHPELISDQWKLINQDEEAFKAEGELMQKAEAAEQEGNFQLAKKLYKQIEAESKIQDYRIFSQAGLYRVSATES